MRRLVRPITEHIPEPSKGFGSLQVLQMVVPRDLSRKQPTSPKRCAFLTSSLGKWC